MGSGLQHSWSSQGWIRVQCLARGHARLQWEAGQQPCVIYYGGQNMGIPSFWPFLFANLWWTDPDLTLLTAPGLALWLLQALSYSVKQQCLHSLWSSIPGKNWDADRFVTVPCSMALALSWEGNSAQERGSDKTNFMGLSLFWAFPTPC